MTTLREAHYNRTRFSQTESCSSQDSTVYEKKEESVGISASSSPRNSSLWAQKINSKTRDTNGGQYTDYPSGRTLAFVVSGLCAAVFLLSVDRTIVTTVIPYLSNEFHSFRNFAWYGSAYLLTASVLQPLFARIYDGFHLKWTLVSALIVFEVGSVVCATATTSTTFVIGRAITGVGSAGILSGAFIIVVHSVPLSKRPLYTACIGIVYSLGSVAGPLLGGVFTSQVTWRWCFWLNLPVGGFSALTIIPFNPKKQNSENSTASLKRRLMRLDFFGSTLLVGSVLMLLLALNYVDLGMSWAASRTIGLLVGSGITMLSFVGWQLYLGDTALIPPALFRQQSVVFACANAVFLYATLLIHVYFLSIWFQTVQSRSALDAGIYLLAYIVPSAIATFIAGAFTTKTGYIAPFAWAGCGIATIGAGLLVTMHPSIPTGNWIGYLILTGFGTGLAVQQVFTAVQTVLPSDLAPIGSTTITFCQTLGGAVFIYINNTILIEELRRMEVPGVDVVKLLSAGATVFEHLVPPASRLSVRSAYTDALRDVFIVGAVTAGLAFLSSLGLVVNRKGNRSEEVSTADDGQAEKSIGG